MKRVNNHIRAAVWIILYASVPLLVGVAIFVDINPSGIRSFDVIPGRHHPMVSQFFPAQRLGRAGNGAQGIIAEPVYITVRYPHRYDRALVRFDIDAPKEQDVRIGIAVDRAENFRYAFKRTDAYGVAVFDLSQAFVEDGKLRFILALPGYEPTGGATIRGVSIVFEREPVLRTIWRRVTERF